MAKNILIINPFGVGDVLFSTVLISAIKERYSGCNIGYICNIRTREILETNPDVKEIFVFERDEYRLLWRKSKIKGLKKFYNFWKHVQAKRFDIVIDLSLGKEYAFFSWLIGIKERRGFDYKGRGRFLTHRIPFSGFNDKPVAEYYLDLIDFRLGAKKSKTVLRYTDKDKSYIDDFLKEKGIKGTDAVIGVAPGGGISFGKKDEEKRRWGIEKFSELCDRIIENFSVKLILIWGPGEEDLVKDIKRLMKKKALISPKTTIREMAALCDRCSIVICSEGGPLHIASSQNTKTISVFGPVDEKVYGPYPTGGDNVVVTSDIDCRPCYKHFKLPECDSRRCLDIITVDTVFNAFLKLRT